MFKPGDIVRYATPARGEEDARFVVLEAHYDVPIPRARIRLIDSGIRGSVMQIEPEEILAIVELQQAQ